MSIAIQVSYGELLDKITILEIKSARITDPDKLANVQAELAALLASWRGTGLDETLVAGERGALRAVNERLWEIEDDIRDHERRGDFGPAFVALARSIYRANDERAALKRRIDERLGSGIVEEKSYAAY